MKKISDIKVGYSCNNNCIHCVIADNREQLIKKKLPVDRTTDECKKEILDSKKKGAQEIIITGGEPTIRKDFLILLSLLKEESLDVLLQTNGRMLKDPEFVRELSAFPIRVYGIAMHGPCPEIHDQITRMKGSFADTAKGIENLVSNHRFVQVKFVISKINYKFIKETIDLVNDLKIKFINLTFPHGIGNAGKYFEKVVPKYSEISPYLLEALKYCWEKGVVVETEAVPYCFLEGFEECASEHFISANFIEARPVRSDTYNWSKRRLEIKRKGNQCNEKCLYARVCEGPWQEYIEYYGDSEFAPLEAVDENLFYFLAKYKKIKDYRSGKLRQAVLVDDKKK